MRKKDVQKFYRIERLNNVVAILGAKEGADPMAEALKGGDVVGIAEITPEEADTLKAARAPRAATIKTVAGDKVAVIGGIDAHAIDVIDKALQATAGRMDVMQRQIGEATVEAGRAKFDVLRHMEALDALDSAEVTVEQFPLLVATCPSGTDVRTFAGSVLQSNLDWAMGKVS
jgi:hypothetical protein